MTHLVGIDLGTSGARITAYNPEGAVVLNNEADIEHQTVDEWHRALREAALYLRQDRVVCSVDGTSGTAVLVDEYGVPVFRPQMYHESAPTQAAALAKQTAVEDLAGRGVSISATSPLPKIMALEERHPERFEQVEWVLSPATWLVYRLHFEPDERWRELETDWTNALKFGEDITQSDPEWFTPLFEAAGVPLDLFPAIRPPGTEVGRANSDFAEDIGLNGAELYQGMTDGNASALAAGCLEPGDYSITCGSTSVVKYVSESIEPHDALYYHRHPIEGYLSGAAFETGIIVKWFCDRVLDISQEHGLELAQTVTPGDEYSAYIQGNRSPFYDPRMGNSIFGIWPDNDLTTPEVRGRLVRGLVTSIVLSEYTYFPLIEDHFDTSVDVLQLVGGGTPGGDDPFSWWNQVRASIWNRPIVKMEPRTTVGPLIPAALAASVYDDVDEASEALLRATGVVEPVDDIRDAYATARPQFRDRWEDVHELYAEWRD